MSDILSESESGTLGDLADAIISGMEAQIEVDGKRIDNLPAPPELYRKFISELQCLHRRLQAAYQQTGMEEEIVVRSRLIGRLINYLELNVPRAWTENA